MTKSKAYRHGEIMFVEIGKLPDELEEAKTDIIITGSNNNPHTFRGGKLYFKNVDEWIFGYFEAKDTILYHCEHGEGKGKLREAKLPNGIYEIRRANEKINKELRQIKD